MPYTQMKTAPTPLPVVGTSGVHIELADGRRLIDAISSWWTAAHGYNHPHIVAAIQRQLQTMPHVMLGGLHHQPALELAGKLSRLLPGSLNRAFFCDSGSVAVEVALKIAVQYWLNQNRQGKNRFVSIANSYHGDTVGAMSVCDPLDSMHAHFKGFLLEQFPTELPRTDHQWARFENFLQQKQGVLAGVIIEPLIQAACGMRFHTPAQLHRLANVCQRHGLLLIADEIATGFGRTGTLFACEAAQVVPDLICLGKALTGGAIGMAATVATDGLFESFYTDDPGQALMHGPTFMGNPLACAAAIASIELFEREPRLQQAGRIEQTCRSKLAPLVSVPGVTDVRCRGAVAAVQFSSELPKYELMKAAVEQGVWLRPIRDVIYLMPPLIIEDYQLQHVCDVVCDLAHRFHALIANSA